MDFFACKTFGMKVVREYEPPYNFYDYTPTFASRNDVEHKCAWYHLKISDRHLDYKGSQFAKNIMFYCIALSVLAIDSILVFHIGIPYSPSR